MDSFKAAAICMNNSYTNITKSQALAAITSQSNLNFASLG